MVRQHFPLTRLHWPLSRLSPDVCCSRSYISYSSPRGQIQVCGEHWREESVQLPLLHPKQTTIIRRQRHFQSSIIQRRTITLTCAVRQYLSWTRLRWLLSLDDAHLLTSRHFDISTFRHLDIWTYIAVVHIRVHEDQATCGERWRGKSTDFSFVSSGHTGPGIVVDGFMSEVTL